MRAPCNYSALSVQEMQRVEKYKQQQEMFTALPNQPASCPASGCGVRWKRSWLGKGLRQGMLIPVDGVHEKGRWLSVVQGRLLRQLGLGNLR